MEQETIRTLITGLSSTVAILATVVFGLLTHTRKEKIQRLEKSLRSTYEQYKTLYRVENELLSRLAEATQGNAAALKKEVRKKIYEDGNDHLSLTDTEVNKRMQKL